MSESVFKALYTLFSHILFCHALGARLLLVFFLYVSRLGFASADVPVDDIHDWSKTDFSKASVDLEHMIDGGPGKDGIRSLAQATFETHQKASTWLDSRAPVVVYSRDGEARAYPLQILMYHEIVNDVINQHPIMVTYCPLCNAAMVFSRQHQSKALEFGVTGKVYNNNLVMYDRQSESWWLQFTGEGVVGDYTGGELKLLPSQIVSFSQFQQAYPGGEVLSRDTGFNKKYGVNPYTNYDSRLVPIPWFFRKEFDRRLPAMERVLGIVIDDKAVAFPFSRLKQHALIQMQVADVPLLVLSKAGMASAVDKKIIKESKDILSAVAFSRIVDNKELEFEIRDNHLADLQTGSLWNLFGQAVSGELTGMRLQQVDRGVYFSFAWLDFYSHTVIYDGKKGN